MKPVESILILPSQARFVGAALAFIRAVAVSCDFSDEVTRFIIQHRRGDTDDR